MIQHLKYRPYPPGFLVKPGMTRYLTPDSRICFNYSSQKKPLGRHIRYRVDAN